MQREDPNLWTRLAAEFDSVAAPNSRDSRRTSTGQAELPTPGFSQNRTESTTHALIGRPLRVWDTFRAYSSTDSAAQPRVGSLFARKRRATETGVGSARGADLNSASGGRNVGAGFSSAATVDERGRFGGGRVFSSPFGSILSSSSATGALDSGTAFSRSAKLEAESTQRSARPKFQASEFRKTSSQAPDPPSLQVGRQRGLSSSYSDRTLDVGSNPSQTEFPSPRQKVGGAGARSLKNYRHFEKHQSVPSLPSLPEPHAVHPPYPSQQFRNTTVYVKHLEGALRQAELNCQAAEATNNELARTCAVLRTEVATRDKRIAELLAQRGVGSSESLEILQIEISHLRQINADLHQQVSCFVDDMTWHSAAPDPPAEERKHSSPPFRSTALLAPFPSTKILPSNARVSEKSASPSKVTQLLQAGGWEPFQAKAQTPTTFSNSILQPSQPDGATSSGELKSSQGSGVAKNVSPSSLPEGKKTKKKTKKGRVPTESKKKKRESPERKSVTPNVLRNPFSSTFSRDTSPATPEPPERQKSIPDIFPTEVQSSVPSETPLIDEGEPGVPFAEEKDQDARPEEPPPPPSPLDFPPVDFPRTVITKPENPHLPGSSPVL